MSEKDSQNSIASDFSTRQQCSKLDSRGKLNSSLPCRWESMFEKLKSYKQQYGDCLVPNRYEEDRSLGSWVSTQRRYFKLMNSSESIGNSKNPKVNEMRIAKLHDIGFVWVASDPRHTPWETRFQELCEYKERHGK
jgi:Helicase associated domain